MPEGPEVRVISDQLKCIIKRRITLIEIADTKFVDLQQIKLPIIITDISCYGKRILIHLGDIILVSFLGMEGRWSFSEGKHTRVKLNLETEPCEYAPGYTLVIKSVLHFDDSRRFGYLKIFDSKSITNYLSGFGPDILATEVSSELWQRLIKGKRKITDVLLDQKVIAGIGNYLKSDILYMAKVSPHRTVDTLTFYEKEQIRVASHIIIRKAYNGNGLTLRSYWDMHGKKGDYKPLVYGRTNDDYGNAIIKDAGNNKRSTYWVKEIQV